MARGQVAILDGPLLKMSQLIAEDNLALVDHEHGEYADGDPAPYGLLGFSAMDADDSRFLSNDALESDLDVFECALEVTNVSDEFREIKRAAISFLHVLGTEIASYCAFIELV
jgi:hypothetical protein